MSGWDGNVKPESKKRMLMTRASFECLDCHEMVELYATSPDKLRTLALRGVEAMRLHIEGDCKIKPDPEEIEVKT